MARTQPVTALRGSTGGSGGVRGASRFRTVLAVGQVALSMAALGLAGLLLRSFDRLHRVAPGFDPNDLYSAAVVLSGDRYTDDAAAARFFETALMEIRALSGVDGVGMIQGLPFSDMANSSGTFAIKGEAYDDARVPPHAYQRTIDEGFIDAAGVPLLLGRNFNAGDRAGTTPVATPAHANAD